MGFDLVSSGMQQPGVIFQPSGKKAAVSVGQTLLEAAEAAGVYLNTLCGGDGICGKCKVRVTSGSVDSDATQLLKPEEIRAGFVLACKARVTGDVVVETPPEPETKDEQIVVSDTPPPAAAMFTRGGDVVGTDLSPTVPSLVSSTESLASRLLGGPLTTKVFLSLPPPTLLDTLSDLDRIYRELSRSGEILILQTGLANIRNLAGFLRDAHWSVTATLGRRGKTTELVSLEKGDTSKNNLGLAIDIGTTTIVVQLVDLLTGRVIATKASTNRQAKYGDDVISRIIFASERTGLQTLHDIVVETLNRLISYAVVESGVRLSDVTAAVCGGNTTMIHLLLAIDPTFLRKEPYIAVANDVPVMRAAEAGIRINPRGLLLSLPGVSSYVGGDISAGVVASGMSRSAETCMLMDVGTNGEIVLGNQDWLVSCSASAGPCFEGSGISAGMRASTGAIQKVQITRMPEQAGVCHSDPERREGEESPIHSTEDILRPSSRSGQALRAQNDKSSQRCSTVPSSPCPGVPSSHCPIAPLSHDQDPFDVSYDTVHDAKPRGICGSGMIDVISELLRVGIIDRAGKMDASLRSKRLRRREDGENEFVLVWAKDTEFGRDLAVTQADISNIIRAKGALFAGARVLARKMGLQCKDVNKFFIAGGFGNYIDIEKAIRIGMIPDIERSKIQFIGNGSLAGARLALVSGEALEEAYRVADKMTYIELSTDNTFLEEFTAALFLPHTDMSLFPSLGA